MDQNRRGFLQSFSSPFVKPGEESALIRLPYNNDPSLFQKECITCETKPCIAVCDEEIIKVYEDKSVYIDFSKRGCTYCDDCADVCELGVLTVETPSPHIKADIKLDMTKCVAWHDVICNACGDVCYDRAIKFLGMFRPEINYENCTNCGFCVGVCPSYAISATLQKDEIT
ncbi:MAG: 4Fe-4S binding protein [Epsilonproteobacteria bacterium]|nr:4Fe-4S binding protein [Campylobacterota bacterium]